MARCAVVRGDTVEAVIIAYPSADKPYEGTVLIPTDDQRVIVGVKWNSTDGFVLPPPASTIIPDTIASF